MAVGLCLLYISESHDSALIALAITGAGAATLLPISLTLVSDMLHTERVYAVTICASQLIPALLLFGLSGGLLGDYGLQTTIVASIALTFLCLVSSYALPSGQTSPKEATTRRDSPWLGLVSLLGLALSFAGFAAMWAFFEIIAMQAALPSEFSARWIAIGLLMTAAGSLAAAWAADRFGRYPPLIGPTFVALVGASLLNVTVDKITYPTALVIFPFAYYVTLIYILAIIADADPKGTYSSLMSFALALGAITGPALYGYVRGAGGPETLVIGIFLVGGIALLAWVQRALLQGKLTP